MAGRTSEELVLVASAVMRELPLEVRAFRADGGCVDLRIISAGDRAVRAEASCLDVRDHMRLVLPVGRGGEGGYEIGCVVSGVVFVGGLRANLDLEITSVARRKPFRTLRRAASSQLALVTAINCQQVRAQLEFETRLLDISTEGFAVSGTHGLVVGDLVGLSTTIGAVVITLEGRVRHITRERFGRIRVGFEVVAISDAARMVIARLVESQPVSGSLGTRRQPKAA